MEFLEYYLLQIEVIIHVIGLTYRLNKYKLRIQDLLEEILEDKEIKKSASGKEEKKVVNDAKDKAEKLLKDVDGILTKMKKK